MKKILIVLSVIVAFSCSDKQTPADMILSGGVIYTMDDASPTAEAVAVSDGKIIFVGTEAEVQKYKGEKLFVHLPCQYVNNINDFFVIFFHQFDIFLKL